MTVAALATPPLFPRPRLVERLQWESQHPVTVIEAPLGFGKTIAVKQFVAATGCDPIWCTLVGERCPADQVLARIVAEIQLRFRTAAKKTRVRHVTAVAGLMAERLPPNSVVVIDNIDLLTDEGVATLVRLIELLPTLKWILAGRSSARWPIGRWFPEKICGFPVGSADLRFTEEEAEAMLLAHRAERRVMFSLIYLADGWPIVLGFATIALASNAADPAAAVRDMIERYIRDELIPSLTPAEWELLTYAMAIGDLRWDWIEAIGLPNGFETLRSLRSRAPWYEVRDGRFRLPKIIALVIARIVAGDRQTYNSIYQVASKINEDNDRPFAALRGYLHAGDVDAAARVIRKEGLTMAFAIDCRAFEVSLSNINAEEGGPLILALRAVYEWRRMRIELAERDFQLALESSQTQADGALIATVYAQALIFSLRPKEALHVLQRHEPHRLEAQRLCYYAALAIAQYSNGEVTESQTSFETACDLLKRQHGSTSVAWALVDLAYYCLRRDDMEGAARYGLWAYDVAEYFNAQTLMARALLFQALMRRNTLDDDDVKRNRTIRLLQRAHVQAEAAQDRGLELRCLKAMLGESIVRGHDSYIQLWEGELRRLSPLLPGLDADFILMQGHALRAAWSGDFASAARISRAAFQSAVFPYNRISRMAEYTLYATQIGNVDPFQESDELLTYLENCPIHGKRAYALGLYGLARTLAGKGASELRLAALEAERADSDTARAFVRGTQAYADAIRSGRPLDGSIRELLRRSRLGGWARVYDRLKPAVSQPPSLSPMETETLLGVQRGLTSKEIAAARGVSPETVETQIGAIRRKLQAASRREAVDLAERYGLIQRQNLANGGGRLSRMTR